MFGLIGTPFFRVIKRYIKIETRKSAQPGHRIELHGWTPAPIVRQALDFEMPCVACGRAIHPFRQRGENGHIFYAATCPLTVNIGCSRGGAARDEYRRVVAAVDGQPPRGQGELFR